MLQQEMTLARWLFNPFVRIAGWGSLAAGLAGIFLAGIAAAAAGIRFDGLLDMHIVGNVPTHVPIVEGLINWISIVAVSALFAKLFGGGSSVRLLDVAGTLALARAPLVLAASICTIPWIRDSLSYSAILAEGDLTSLLPGMLVGALVLLACAVWTIVLMWNAFSIAGNMKDVRGAVLFVAALAVGELLSKLLVYRIP